MKICLAFRACCVTLSSLINVGIFSCPCCSEWFCFRARCTLLLCYTVNVMHIFYSHPSFMGGLGLEPIASSTGLKAGEQHIHNVNVIVLPSLPESTQTQTKKITASYFTVITTFSTQSSPFGNQVFLMSVYLLVWLIQTFAFTIQPLWIMSRKVLGCSAG